MSSPMQTLLNSEEGPEPIPLSQAPILSNRERMMKSMVYDGLDPQFEDDRLQAKIHCYTLNHMHPSVPESERYAVYEKLFGKIGSNVEFEGPICCTYGYNTTIGDNFYCNNNVTILDYGSVTIGNDVMLAPNVSLLTVGHPLVAEQRNDGWEIAKPIRIGNSVWLGAGVIVLGGVTIGDNTIVGAGSVVTKSLPSNVVAVGNPCRVLKTISERDLVALPPRAHELLEQQLQTEKSANAYHAKMVDYNTEIDNDNNNNQTIPVHPQQPEAMAAAAAPSTATAVPSKPPMDLHNDPDNNHTTMTKPFSPQFGSPMYMSCNPQSLTSHMVSGASFHDIVSITDDEPSFMTPSCTILNVLSNKQHTPIHTTAGSSLPTHQIQPSHLYTQQQQQKQQQQQPLNNGMMSLADLENPDLDLPPSLPSNEINALLESSHLGFPTLLLNTSNDTNPSPSQGDANSALMVNQHPIIFTPPQQQQQIADQQAPLSRHEQQALLQTQVLEAENAIRDAHLTKPRHVHQHHHLINGQDPRDTSQSSEGFSSLCDSSDCSHMITTSSSGDEDDDSSDDDIHPHQPLRHHSYHQNNKALAKNNGAFGDDDDRHSIQSGITNLSLVANHHPRQRRKHKRILDKLIKPVDAHPYPPMGPGYHLTHHRLDTATSGFASPNPTTTQDQVFIPEYNAMMTVKPSSQMKSKKNPPIPIVTADDMLQVPTAATTTANASTTVHDSESIKIPSFSQNPSENNIRSQFASPPLMAVAAPPNASTHDPIDISIGIGNPSNILPSRPTLHPSTTGSAASSSLVAINASSLQKQLGSSSSQAYSFLTRDFNDFSLDNDNDHSLFQTSNYRTPTSLTSSALHRTPNTELLHSKTTAQPSL